MRGHRHDSAMPASLDWAAVTCLSCAEGAVAASGAGAASMYFAAFSTVVTATGSSPRLTITDGALVWAVDFDLEGMGPKLKRCVMRERGETDAKRLQSFVQRLRHGVDGIAGDSRSGFTCALQVRSTALTFTLNSAVTKHEFELGAEDSASKRRDAIAWMMHAQSKRALCAERETHQLAKEKAELVSDRDEARAFAEGMVDERQQEARDQLNCFVLLLNEKKREIKRLRANGADELAACGRGGGGGGGGGADGDSGGGNDSDGDSTSSDDDTNQKRASEGGGGGRSPAKVRSKGRPREKDGRRRPSRKRARMARPAAVAVSAVAVSAAAVASASAPASATADEPQAASDGESDDLLNELL